MAPQEWNTFFLCLNFYGKSDPRGRRPGISERTALVSFLKAKEAGGAFRPERARDPQGGLSCTAARGASSAEGVCLIPAGELRSRRLRGTVSLPL